jgi:transcriptional antiterminator NusG
MNVNELKWFALYVRSRHEFTTQSELNNKGICAYVPAIKKMRQWSDRKKNVIFPLFPGYVFVQIIPNPEEYLRALRTRGAVKLLSYQPEKPASIPDEEIESLRILLNSGQEINIFPHLKEGERVRIKGGPLRGAEGLLDSKENQYEFIVNIELLGRSVTVKVFGDYLEVA